MKYIEKMMNNREQQRTDRKDTVKSSKRQFQSQREMTEKGARMLFEEVMAKVFQNTARKCNPKIQEAL